MVGSSVYAILDLENLLRVSALVRKKFLVSSVGVGCIRKVNICWFLISTMTSLNVKFVGFESFLTMPSLNVAVRG